VNRAFARQYFHGNAVGKHFYIGQAIQGKFQFASSTVVGIVADVKYDGIENEVQPAFYAPMIQIMRSRADIILRSSIDPAFLSSAMRRAVTAVDREQPVFDVQTMDEQVSNLLSRRRLIMLLIACFALLAVFLSAVGIYGVFMYSVSRRKQEMGIRLALGSSRSQLVRLVVLQAARLIIAGGFLGIIVALLCTRLLASMLVGVKPYDPLSFSLAWALMTLIALFASFFPAVNAAQTDLISVLHSE
jgi:putative ABC transport system permease protein